MKYSPWISIAAGWQNGLLLLLSVCLLFPSGVQGQSRGAAMRHFTAEDGLASGHLGGIVQDSRGFLWIATRDGLSRYDGTEFTSFYHHVGDRNTLPSNQINKIVLLGKDRLLLATYNGLCILNTLTMHCQVYQELAHADYYAHNNDFVDVQLDGFHHIWASSRTALYLFDDSLHLLMHWYNPDVPASPYEYVNKIFMRGPGKASIILHGKVYRYLYPAKRFIMDSVLTAAIHPHRNVTFLTNSRYGMWWIKVDNDTLFHWSEADGFKRYAIPRVLDKQRVHLYASLFVLRDSILWCGEVQGTLVKFNMKQRRFSPAYIHVDAPSYIGSWVFTAAMLRDTQQNLWIATINGLYRYKERQFRPLAFDSVFRIKMGPIPSAEINSMIRSEKGFWLGTYGNGVCFIDAASGGVRHFQLSSWLKNWVWNISKYQGDTLWIGTQEGLLWLNEKNCRIGQVRQEGMPSRIGQYNIGVQFLDSHRHLWISVNDQKGLINDDLARQKIVRYKPGFLLPFISAMAEDENGNLWMGSLNGGGLVKWDRETGQFSILHARPHSAFEDDKIVTIYADQKGSLWFNSGTNGLEQYEIAAGRFVNYGRSQGLCSDIIQGISGEGDHLWIATVNGVSWFNTETKQFKTYTVADGLPSNYFSYVLCQNDTVYLGGRMTFLFFKDDLNTGATFTPATYITDVLVRGKPLPLSGKQVVRLPYNQNYIRFDFTGINFIQGAENKYEYKLEGLDKDWVSAGTARFAVYARLAPGAYTFKVRSATGSGVWGSTSAAYSLIIRPPFWTTSWFFIATIVMIFGLVYLFYRYRLHQVLKMQRIRDRIAADLHDDMGASLSNINILSTMALKKTEPEAPVVKKMLENIREDAQQMSEAIDDIIWTVNPQNDSLDRILSRMRYYASELFEAKNIQYEINFPSDSTHVRLPMEKRRDFFLLFKEGVNNIVKHADCTKAVITLALEGGRIKLQLTDNGKGFDTGEPSEGNGLKNMKQRTKALKGTLKVSACPGEGTCLTLMI